MFPGINVNDTEDILSLSPSTFLLKDLTTQIKINTDGLLLFPAFSHDFTFFSFFILGMNSTLFQFFGINIPYLIISIHYSLNGILVTSCVCII